MMISDIRGASILLVDDQEANIVLLERMLRGAGYTCIASTTDPTEVQALHTRQPFDLIILDLQMPGMDGFKVMAQLKQIESGGYLPVLVVTGEPDHKLRALSAGARDFVSKPFDRAEVLMRVYNLIEVRLLHIETKRLYKEVLAQQELSQRLLNNILPSAMALHSRSLPDVAADTLSAVVADSLLEATVLFADLVEFGKPTQTMPSQDVVGLLDELFTEFDHVADARGLEKINAIGNAYLAVAGLPVPVADHAVRAAHMALDMLEAVARFNLRGGYALQVRIGIDSGARVAGVIGKRKFIYDLWGDTVNTASRMESNGVPGRVQMTDATRLRLGDSSLLEERGAILQEGKGPTPTWFLTGRA